ncbi:MAG: DUF192 domain-containing protein [Alphaproteobacteria bacterium]|nr:DUF192 domain-containing protein [Alphaproteobacteria bacterium]
MLCGFAALIFLVVSNPNVPLTKPPPVAPPEGQERVGIKLQDGRTLAYFVELALTPEEQGKGLMDREHLADQSGMLFLFTGDAERNFWMKNTLIPLDIIFIEADGRIHSIYPMATPLDETLISSNGPVRAVLEVKGGQADQYGIQPGDIILNPFFGNTP